jgi:hypothetical protein
MAFVNKSMFYSVEFHILPLNYLQVLGLELCSINTKLEHNTSSEGCH